MPDRLLSQSTSLPTILDGYDAVPYIEKFGAIDNRTNATFDSTAALVAAAAANNGMVRFTPGARYNIQGANIPRLVAITGQTPWNFDQTSDRYLPVLQAPSDCAYVLRVGGDLSQLDTVGVVPGSAPRGFSISGGGHNISDALLVIEVAGYFAGLPGLTNAKGRALRSKVFWDGMLDDPFVRNIDGRGTTGIVTFDVGPTTTGNPSSFWNCNNIRIRGGHFEELAGTVIRALNGCNLDSFTITGHTKFERGGAGQTLPGGASVSNPSDHSALIWLEQCTTALIELAHFNRWNVEDGYDEIVRMGPATGTGATGVRITNCTIQGEVGKTARLLRTYSQATYDVYNNSLAAPSGYLLDPLNGSVRGGRYERPINESQNDQQSRLRSTFGAFNLIDIAQLSTANDFFASDPTAPNSTKSSIRLAGTFQPFAVIPGEFFRGMSQNGLRLGVEGYSATGAGKIELYLPTTGEFGAQTVSRTVGSRGMTWWTLTASQAATLNSGNTLNIITTGDNTEAVTISSAAVVAL